MLNIHSCNYQDLYESLELSYSLPNHRPILVWGETGCGKSSIITQFSEDKNLRLIDIRLGSMEPGDFAIPVINNEKRVLEQFLTELIPFDDVPTLVLFDELPNARTELQIVVYGIILERRLSNHKIPDSVYFVAAGNRQEDECGVQEMTRALASRFTHLHLVPNLKMWMDGFAAKANIAPEVLTFLKAKPEYFSGAIFGDLEDKMILPSPRSWEAVSDLIKQSPSRRVLELNVSGCIGKEVAAEFFLTVDELSNLPSIARLFEADEAEIATLTKSVNTLSLLYGLAYSCLSYASNTKQIDQAAIIFSIVSEVKDDIQRNEVWAMVSEKLVAKLHSLGEKGALLKYMKSEGYKRFERKNQDVLELYGLGLL